MAMMASIRRTDSSRLAHIVLAATVLVAVASAPSHAETDSEVERLVSRRIQEMRSADGIGGAAVVVRIEGRTLFFNYGFAEGTDTRPITSDTLFNLASLRKVFDATMLGQAVVRGEIKLDDPVAKYVTELQRGRDIRRVTVGELATHTSGLLFPQDHPPWPDWGYTLPQFIRTLNAWRADKAHQPGGQHIYTHGGYVLLQLVLEHAMGAPIDELLGQRLLQPLRLAATTLPRRDNSPHGHLTPEQLRRAVQGYDEHGFPIGKPGDQQGRYYWPGTSQMYSSARDLATFLAAYLGEIPVEASVRDACALAQRSMVMFEPGKFQGLAWEIIADGAPAIVEKYGGLNNASSYMAMMPSRRLGIVILTNRGNQYPNEVGRRILRELSAP